MFPYVKEFYLLIWIFPVFGNELTGTSGEIANPFYPNPFMYHIDNINWRVTVGFGSAVKITFKQIHMDDFYSVMCLSSLTVSFFFCFFKFSISGLYWAKKFFLKIFDGYDETAPKLIKVCGLNKPDSVVSSSNVVYIVFTHSQVIHGSLFFLEWTEVTKPGNVIQSTTTRI